MIPLDRYDRQIRVPGVGLSGQRRIQSSSVLVVGSGGLGSPVLTYLCSAGVGRMGLVDFDVVEISNLPRQSLHSDATIGRPKVESAINSLKKFATGTSFVSYPTSFDSASWKDIMEAGWDLAIDTTDGLRARYALTDACYLHGIPLLWASVYQFYGQVGISAANSDLACYRCLFPTPPPPELAPNCSEAGVLGPVCGTIGSLEATEALKLLTGFDSPLRNGILDVNLIQMTFSLHPVSKNPDCALCGSSRTINTVVDIPDSCSLFQKISTPTVSSPEDLMDPLVIDIREKWQFDGGHIEGAINCSAESVIDSVRGINRSILVYCDIGRESSQIVADLLANGHDAYSLKGGWDAFTRR